MNYIIKGGTVVNEGKSIVADVIVKDGRIQNIVTPGSLPAVEEGEMEVVDAAGCLVMPGVIDTHVHFREPGLTHKADIESESRAAAFGGVTSYFDMPNTNPQTTTLEALQQKWQLGEEKSHINYAFFPGATNDNIEELAKLDLTRIPGIKLFMGSSTGNMLVDKYGSLLKIFRTAKELDLVVMAHCEDTEIINRNMEQVKKQMGEDPDVMFHPLIRSEEACMESSCLAASLARQFGAKLHIAHVSTQAELEALIPDASQKENAPTLEATVAHLLFCNADYATKRALIKCNPAIKKDTDRDALRRALMDGRIETIGTDHAPHALSEKQGGAAKAMSGMPSIQFSLVSMLKLVDEGILTVERLVELMAHNPAKLFSVKERGFLRPGYKADITIVRQSEPWTVTENVIQSKCGWSPMQGMEYRWAVRDTICNGQFVLRNGSFDNSSKGEAVEFERNSKLPN